MGFLESVEDPMISNLYKSLSNNDAVYHTHIHDAALQHTLLTLKAQTAH